MIITGNVVAVSSIYLDQFEPIMAQTIRIKKSFCTTREAAEMLGVSLRTAQLWVESGLLDAWKTEGGHRRITRQSIERLLVNPAIHGSSERVVPSEPPSSVADGPALAVMVVEDEATLRRLYQLSLARWPMHPNVTIAGDGYEALIRMGHAKPDLLIADLQMPGMDGFRMIRTIRSVPELSAMAIVVVSGLDQAEIAERGGLPDDIPVLPKPIPFDRLREIAERLAARRIPNVPRGLT
jgi:excisionase family DNA binding protein